MSNVDRPFGARVAYGGHAGQYNARVTRYEADDNRNATNNAGDIYLGDFVKLNNGKVEPAVSGDTFLGVVVAIGHTPDQTHGEPGPFNPPGLEKRHLEYDEEGFVWVIDDPNVVIEVQDNADDETEAGNLDDVEGDTRDIELAADQAHGSRTTGNSDVEMEHNADVNNDLRVVGFVRRADNERGLPHGKWLVRINNHLYG